MVWLVLFLSLVSTAAAQSRALLAVGACGGSSCPENSYGPMKNLSLYKPSKTMTTYILHDSYDNNGGTTNTRNALSFSICRNLNDTFNGDFSLNKLRLPDGTPDPKYARNIATGSAGGFCASQWISTKWVSWNFNPKLGTYVYGYETTFYDPRNTSAQVFADAYATIMSDPAKKTIFFLNYFHNYNIGNFRQAARDVDLNASKLSFKTFESYAYFSSIMPTEPSAKKNVPQSVLVIVFIPVMALAAFVFVLACLSPMPSPFLKGTRAAEQRNPGGAYRL